MAKDRLELKFSGNVCFVRNFPDVKRKWIKVDNVKLISVISRYERTEKVFREYFNRRDRSADYTLDTPENIPIRKDDKIVFYLAKYVEGGPFMLFLRSRDEDIQLTRTIYPYRLERIVEGEIAETYECGKKWEDKN